MCIRDRAGAVVGGLVLSALPVSRRPGRMVILSVACYGVAAVSYTHLRAHETVLDLVCRLLLEKKNKENR